MRFISIREMRAGSAKLWAALKEEDFVLTQSGKPIAILSAVSENNVEETLKAFRQARAMMALETIHKTAEVTGADKISEADIEKEIKLARKQDK